MHANPLTTSHDSVSGPLQLSHREAGPLLPRGSNPLGQTAAAEEDLPPAETEAASDGSPLNGRNYDRGVYEELVLLVHQDVLF